MFPALQVSVLLLIALAMVPAVAHALELPGKLRLSMDAYRAVQPIYWPGFTLVGGFAEIGSMIATFGMLFLMPRHSSAFWLTLAAFASLLLMHAVFWIFTQPVNRFWLRGQALDKASTAFFAAGRRIDQSSDWTALRNRWEYSHVARALLATAALILFAAAITAI